MQVALLCLLFIVYYIVFFFNQPTLNPFETKRDCVFLWKWNKGEVFINS
jgi:hypothetical protein